MLGRACIGVGMTIAFTSIPAHVTINYMFPYITYCIYIDVNCVCAGERLASRSLRATIASGVVGSSHSKIWPIHVLEAVSMNLVSEARNI